MAPGPSPSGVARRTARWRPWFNVILADEMTMRLPYLLFANTFATSRAYSMKSWATGLSVRFLKMAMPNGYG
jgi:hypothetical protein